jgi:hypothetical protein
MAVIRGVAASASCASCWREKFQMQTALVAQGVSRNVTSETFGALRNTCDCTYLATHDVLRAHEILTFRAYILS